MKNGNKKSGIYTIYINNNRSKPIEVYCDMDTDGGGWLVRIIAQLHRPNYGKTNFSIRCQDVNNTCLLFIIIYINVFCLISVYHVDRIYITAQQNQLHNVFCGFSKSEN